MRETFAHADFGYAEEKMVVIPNGFDCREFRPCVEARTAVRRELGIPDDAPIIGLVGRYDPQKDHANFLRAAGILHQLVPDAYFMLVGAEITWDNKDIADLAHSVGIGDRVRLLGTRDDIARLISALDLAASSSCSEGFPNVIGEAMASGVPCVVTNVGDSARIVSEYGLVVPRRDPAAMAAACHSILRKDRHYREQLGLAARAHIERTFPLSSTIDRYQELYLECARTTQNHKPVGNTP